jgi:hypothetical protein
MAGIQGGVQGISHPGRIGGAETGEVQGSKARVYDCGGVP